MPPSRQKEFRIPIIYYHSVGPVNHCWNRNFLTLELKYFRDQLDYFARSYQVIGLKEYWEIKNGLRNPVNNALVITFDDGFLDNWSWAFPLLKKYGFKATIFVCPEFVDLKNGVRPNLEDLEQGRGSLEDITRGGYLSWEEMKRMEASGLVDIQAHTMTHTKYFVSDKLVGFHQPGADILYPAGNLFPEQKPYSIVGDNFEKLLPFGFPFFEEQSSVIAKRVTINPEFINECVNVLKKYDFCNYIFEEVLAMVGPLYGAFKEKGNLIIACESEDAYLKRLDYEIVEAKKIIENKLQKKVEFLCWPHGDSNVISHQMAISAEYLATTTGSNQKIPDSLDRIPKRIGLYHSKHNRFLSKLKTQYQINRFLGTFPYKQINSVYYYLKYGTKEF
jgi:hypothetical protein